MDIVEPANASKEEDVRNWLELPPDVMSMIFLKLGTLEILAKAQLVCTTWRDLSMNPHLFRSVDIKVEYSPTEGNIGYLVKMAKKAVDRSCGQLVEISLDSFPTNELLLYIADKSSSLRRLQLVSCFGIKENGFIDMVKKLPHLEEVEILDGFLSWRAYEVVGRFCPQLKSFRLNFDNDYHDYATGDGDAQVIAEHMKGLHHLNLFGSTLSDKGLQAILSGCPLLESLDLRKCRNVSQAAMEDLKKRCADGNRKVKFPNDPANDYEFNDVFGLSNHYPDYYDLAQDEEPYLDDDDNNIYLTFYVP